MQESVVAGIIWLSSSPAGAGFFFFCGQKGQNNSTLNAVTDKNRKSLPPFSSAFESHQGGNTFPNRIKRTLTTIFFSKSEHEHAQHVFSVLQRLLQNQLFIKAEKFQFHVSEVSFLGLVVTISLYFIPSLMGKQSVKNRRWRLPCTTSPLVIPHPGLSNSSGWNMHTTPSPVLPLVSCLFSVPDDTSQHSLQSKNDRPTIHQSRSALLSTHLEAGLTLTPLPSRC